MDFALLEGLPPLGVALVGVALIMFAVACELINKKLLEDDMFVLNIVSLLCGAGGIAALWQVIF